MTRFPIFLALIAVLGFAACDSSSDNNSTTDASTTSDAPATSTTKFPAVTVKDCDGNDVVLLDAFAKTEVTYVTWGAGWCTACQKEAPVINSTIVDGLAGKSVQTFQILVESNNPGEAPPQALCAQWRDSLQAKYTILIDPAQNSVAALFPGGVGTLPRHQIVTKDSSVRFDKLGDIPDDMAQRLTDWLP